MASQKLFHVLMFPWLAHGHISPFLELAKKLIDSKNFFIYFCSTPINLISITKKLSDEHNKKYSDSIQLVDHHLPIFPDLPPHYHTTNGLPPHLNSTLRKACDMSIPNFSKILSTKNPDLLISDDFFQWPEVVASLHNIPMVRFLTTGATVGCLLTHMFAKPEDEFPFSAIQLFHEYEKDAARRCVAIVFGSGREEPHKMLLIKTSSVIERKYLDYFALLGNMKIMPVGALIQHHPAQDQGDDVEVIQWLNKKDPCSTVFVSFGSEHFLKKEEIEEMAQGLELSNVNFIWVVRFPMGEEKFKLPVGFVERVGERGMVVEGWAPQARILGHSSIGGFVSHCGWNSVLESIYFGVPIIGMSIQYDQPINAKLVVELGVCEEIKRDNNGRFQREEVGKVIREVVGEKKGEDLRKKAKELGEKMKEKSEEEIDAVLKELVQICDKRKGTIV